MCGASVPIIGSKLKNEMNKSNIQLANNLVWIGAVLVFSAVFPLFGQSNDLQSDDFFTETCEETCPHSIKECHYERAQIFLYRAILGAPLACSMIKSSELNALGKLERQVLGIEELSNAVGQLSEKSAKYYKWKLELASAKIELAETYRNKDDYEDFINILDEAGCIYFSIAEQTVHSNNSYLIRTAAIGLIRTGRSLDAVRILKAWSTDDPERSYLIAESLFSLGNRSAASTEYESWISTGCNSKLALIVNNGYRDTWTFLPSRQAADLSLCEQLPMELRSRLENLHRQYGHPNNLPRKSIPSDLFRNLIL
jgi:tetratricopeptide (TPR) repeat protein